MPLRGAIFDCDGTILDSMPMWSDTCVALLERYGVSDARRVFGEHESLDMDEKCYWYHDNLGIGESGEQLYRELWRMVEQAYKVSVKPFSGCRELLQALANRGVPLCVASATPTELLREALAAHDLLRYFDRLVFAGDVGRGKEHPDVYLAACELLGTPREDTWVFEDAPFGIRSAARVGFPVVGMLNDHDGRDEAFVERWATLTARSYGELGLERLDHARPRVLNSLVVGGSPKASAAGLVGSLASGADFVVAADRGVCVLREAGLAPDVVCGDADSAGEADMRWVREAGAREVRFPAEKDDTDLGLAIACVREEAERLGMAARLTVSCVSGGRPDHWLGVWGVLARNADLCVRVVEDEFECRLLTRERDDAWSPDVAVGATVSVVALAKSTVASEHGMRWELDHATLEPLSDLGVSNRVVGLPCEVRCHSGILAAFAIRA